MKRSLAFILALVLLLGMVPVQALATETTDETLVTEATVVTEPTETLETTEATEEVMVAETEAAHTHEYATAVTMPTCTKKGYTTYTCDCGDSYVDDYVDAMHTYENGTCTDCGTVDPDATEPLPLRYDDHYDVTGKTVEIIDAGTPTSYQVGYGVEENKVLDTAVVTLKGNTLVATGIGTATVTIDGETYEITVTAAPISLLLLIGQSNAEGMEGNANQSVVCPDGMVYSTYAKSNGLTGDAGLTVENAGNYVPSSLAGTYSTVNINGTNTKLSAYPVDSLTAAGAGKYGMDSGLAYEWVKQTGEKVWVVNAAHGASSITSWQKGAENFDQAVALFSTCQNVLQAEICAGHYTFSHMGYYWNQGCADETKTAEWYVNQYLAMHENLKADLTCDMDNNPATANNTLEFSNIVLVQAGHSTATGYRKGSYEDTSDSFFMTYKELELRGPRVAQIWMANNPELTDIHIVSTLAQDWVTMPDGTDGVEQYFQSVYENGTVDYTTQVKQSASWYTPTTPAAVKDSIHYNQIGYNEIGRESARNTLYILGILEKPQVQTTVNFLNWTGYELVNTIKTSGTGISDTLVVPLVYPCYESKTVTYTLSDGLSWNFYDLLDTGVDGGILTASIGAQLVAVTGREYYSYRFEMADGKIVSVNDDRFQKNLLTVTGSNTYTLSDPILLKHSNSWIVEFNSVAPDRFMALASSVTPKDGMFYFFKSKSGSGVLSIGEYKDGLYQNYGLKQSQIKVDWNQPHVYRFQNMLNDDGTNTIHIYVNDEWVGTATNLIINDVLKSTDNMYLSGKDFAFSSIGCSGFGLANGQMTYLEIYENHHTHNYENGNCTTCGEAQPGPVITQQPESVEQEIGKKFSISPKVEGEGLTYQWYVKESGAKAFKVSSNKTASYAYTMQSYMHNRQVYCVITDQYGNQVTTETAVITRPALALKIMEQPKDVQVKLGQKFSIRPSVQGDDLRYQWYYKESYQKNFSLSSNKTSAYAYTMASYMNGRSVYCVITDKYGNSATTDVATISLPPVELKILTQPKNVVAAKGEKFSVKPVVQGDGLTYQWYYKESYQKNFSLSSNRTSAYAYTMASYMNGRSVYCVITDQYGNQVTTDVVTLFVTK